MQHLFLNKELSLLAKEKGFDESCFAFWHKDDELFRIIGRAKNSESSDKMIQAPLYQQIIDWFREKHNLEINVSKIAVNSERYSYVITKIDEVDDLLYTSIPDCPLIKSEKNESRSYYRALDKAIEQAFKLI